MGSLAGEATSYKSTEVNEGNLNMVRRVELIVKDCLTVRRTCPTETKVGYSDPTVLNGRAVAYRIKGTLGITG